MTLSSLRKGLKKARGILMQSSQNEYPSAFYFPHDDEDNFRQYPGRRHPSKHMVLMDILFEQPERFLAAYAAAKAVIVEDGRQGAWLLRKILPAIWKR